MRDNIWSHGLKTNAKEFHRRKLGTDGIYKSSGSEPVCGEWDKRGNYEV